MRRCNILADDESLISAGLLVSEMSVRSAHPCREVNLSFGVRRDFAAYAASMSLLVSNVIPTMLTIVRVG